MSRRRKRFISKYENEATYIVGKKVVKIEEQNTVIGDKLKTVFYCESINKPEGRMCIAWGKTNFEVGDIVDMKGRIKDDIFLVWTLMFRKNREKTQ